MNDKIKELAEQAGFYVYNGVISPSSTSEMNTEKMKTFAELIIKEAFRDGIIYSAKKYWHVGDERFTGNDIALFLEMESCEVSDDDILENFGVNYE